MGFETLSRNLQEGGKTKDGVRFAPTLRLTSPKTGKQHSIRPHQARVARRLFLKNQQWLMVKHVMGAGKTVTTMVCVATMRMLHQRSSTLVVVTKSTLPQWEETAKDWLILEDRELVCTMKLDPAAEPGALTIITWEALQIAFKHCNEIIETEAPDARGRMRKTKAWRKKAGTSHILFTKLWGVVFFDDVQKATNVKSQFCLAAAALNKTKSVGLSGTPIQNSADNFAGLVHALGISDPRMQGPAAFQKRGVIDTEMIAQFCGQYVYSVEIDVLNLPPLHTTAVEVPVALDSATVVEYRKAMDRAVELKKRLDNDKADQEDTFEYLAQLQRMQHFTISHLLGTRGAGDFSTDETLLQSAAAENTSFMRAFAHEVQRLFDEGHKRVIVAADRVVPLLIFKTYLELNPVADNTRTFTYIGSMSLEQRNAAKRTFLECCRSVLFLSAPAGGIGVEFASNCSAMLLVPPLPWTFAAVEQVIGRIHRMGQRHPVTVRVLVARGSADWGIAHLYPKKKALDDAMLHGGINPKVKVGLGLRTNTLENMAGTFVPDPATDLFKFGPVPVVHDGCLIPGIPLEKPTAPRA